MTVLRVGLLGFAIATFGSAAAVADASVLSNAAAALQPGHYTTISTGLTANDLQPDSPGGSILDWADSGTWDPVRHQFAFIGKEAGSLSHYRNIVYDEASNSWSYGPVPLDTGYGHGYDGNTADPTTGIHFFKPYDSMTIYRQNGGSWTALPNLPSHIISGIAKSPRGLLYSDLQYDAYYDDATAAWTVVNVGSAYPNDPTLGSYHSIVEYDRVHDVFLIGGGNGSSVRFRVSIVNGSPVRTLMSSAPWEYGVGETDQHTNVVSDPVTGEFIFYKKLTGTFYGYNIMTDTWRQIGTSGDGNMPPLPTGTGTSAAVAAVSTYGVIMWIAQNGTTASVYLYKHATAGPVDSVSPAPPSQLIAR
jgi:hypothetical protein